MKARNHANASGATDASDVGLPANMQELRTRDYTVKPGPIVLGRG